MKNVRNLFFSFLCSHTEISCSKRTSALSLGAEKTFRGTIISVSTCECTKGLSLQLGTDLAMGETTTFVNFRSSLDRWLLCSHPHSVVLGYTRLGDSQLRFSCCLALHLSFPRQTNHSSLFLFTRFIGPVWIKGEKCVRATRLSSPACCRRKGKTRG
jgi:hypothetical protein